MDISKKLVRMAVTAIAAVSLTLPSSLALYQAQVKADALYLRNAPEGDIISTLPNGTVVAVLNNSSSWYKVAVDGKQGYVSGEYLTGSQSTDFSIGTGKIVCDTSVNLRSEPNTSSTILASMKNGTTVTVTGVTKGWFNVTYNDKSGYVHPDYINFDSITAVASTSTTTSSSSTSVISPSANAVAYSGQSADRAAVLAYAAQFLGTPYVYGGSTPSGFDCSGFTSYVFGNTVGTIPRVAQSQYDATTHVSRSDLLPGDLVFFGSSPSSITHVGIYVGDDQFIHSPHTGSVVKYDTISLGYENTFQCGGRVIFD
jgi:cell wall-associated NlpC family hydrolase